MNNWTNTLTKFLKYFYLEYEEDTAEDYKDATSVTSDQTKYKKGGHCSITGMSHKYDQEVSFEDALSSFKRSLTQEEASSIKFSSESEEYADVEEHDTKRDWTTITITKN